MHFGTTDDAYNWYDRLAQDLYSELKCDRLDALILSGDIANKSTPEEYVAAKQFLDDFCQEFQLQPQQIIMVPGNHDLNWKPAETAYSLKRRKDSTNSLYEDHIIDKLEAVPRLLALGLTVEQVAQALLFEFRACKACSTLPAVLVTCKNRYEVALATS